MRVSFLASHGGTAAKHIISAVRNKQLDAGIGVVITNNLDSSIFQWCTESNIDISYISGKTHPNEDEKDAAIHKVLVESGTDIIVLSGYMKKIGPKTLAEYSNKILNIHPSLLPRHGGIGLYGDRVHESVINSGDKESGATVHFISEEYDEGPILSQHKLDVVPGETVESLKLKVQAIEGELYLCSIAKIAK